MTALSHEQRNTDEVAEMKTEGQYTIQKATEYGIGQSVNGTGRRPKITGFYVLNRQGRKVRAFTGQDCEQKANEWAKFCNENFEW